MRCFYCCVHFNWKRLNCQVKYGHSTCPVIKKLLISRVHNSTLFAWQKNSAVVPGFVWNDKKLLFFNRSTKQTPHGRLNNQKSIQQNLRGGQQPLKRTVWHKLQKQTNETISLWLLAVKWAYVEKNTTKFCFRDLWKASTMPNHEKIEKIVSQLKCNFVYKFSFWNFFFSFHLFSINLNFAPTRS